MFKGTLLQIEEELHHAMKAWVKESKARGESPKNLAEAYDIVLREKFPDVSLRVPRS